MAKLSDLKKLVDAAQAKAPAIEPTHATKATVTPPTNNRAIAGTPHAKGEIDLEQAFADVRKLPPSTRARHAPPRPQPIARQSIADATQAWFEHLGPAKEKSRA